MDFDPKAIAGSPFTVGALGALVAAFKATPGASWPERVVNVMAGALVAGFVTPALTDYLKMTTASYVSGAAFVLGLLSMSLVAAVVGALRDTKWADILTGWLSRR